jgi:hypothetical protein
VHPFPETPVLGEATDLTGHLWIQERPTGGRLRFQVAASGLLTFGTPDTATAEELPHPYRRAARTVRERFDREAFLEATDDPAGVTFSGVATWNRGVEYDWAALPLFVATDVWSAARGGFLPPDAAARAVERMGLSAPPAVEKELPRSHTDLDRYADPDAFPPSEWYDGPAAAVLVRDKTGSRGAAENPALEDTSSVGLAADVEDLADRFVIDERVDRATESLRASDRSPTVDAVRDRVVASVVREEYHRLYRDGDPVVEVSAFESAVAERIGRRLRG